MPPRLKVGEAVDLFASFYPNPVDPGWPARDPRDKPRQEFHIQETVWWSEAEAVDSARLGGEPEGCHTG